MKRWAVGFLVGISTLLTLQGCSVQDAVQKDLSNQTAMQSAEDVPSQTHAFDGQLLEIAQSYKEFGAVDDRVRMTYFLCNPGIAGKSYTPPPPHLSASGDATPHGRKLYWLYVKEMPPKSVRGHYTVAGKPNPVGQVVVKEAWHPQEVNQAGDKDVAASASDRQVVEKDGRVLRTGEQAHLFIMYKLDPKTPDTDAGWVYGAVTPDGRQVTSAGRVASCMACHADAPHDRLFGLAEK